MYLDIEIDFHMTMYNSQNIYTRHNSSDTLTSSSNIHETGAMRFTSTRFAILKSGRHIDITISRYLANSARSIFFL